MLFQELLNLVGVGFHLAAVQQEGRLSTRCQVLQDVWLPESGTEKVQKTDGASQKQRKRKKKENRSGKISNRRKLPM